MTSSYCTFYIVRHGETEWNIQQRLQGHADSPLTQNGIAQARERARTFANIQFDEVFSSDVSRTQRTAEIIIADQKIAVKTTQLLREHSYGKYEGRKVEEYLEELKDMIAKRETLAADEQAKFRLADDIETDEEVSTRIITFLRTTAVAYQGKKVLVVSHGGTMRSLLVRLGFATKKELPPHSLKNTGYFILDSDGVDFFIRETCGVAKVSI